MATRTISSATASKPPFSHFYGRTNHSTPIRLDAAPAGNQTHLFSWDRLSSVLPLVHLLQPDYYMVYQFSTPGVPMYQENLHLDLGALPVRYEYIRDHMDEVDRQHLQRMDSVKEQFAVECRLQPFDYISSIIFKWNGPDGDLRYFMRKTTVLGLNDNGWPSLGIVTIKDITPLVSAIKPNNVDITFHPDKANLCYELTRRINAVQPKRPGITEREKDVVRCLCKGMSSKEIASALFISKATVDTHRQNLIHKWEVTNTAALLQRAIAEGCI
jgi:DNA-binding CsgD family transcriptional regulator